MQTSTQELNQEEGTVIPGESEVTSLNPEIHKQAQVDRARQKGWKPLEEFEGDPADWVDAPEFLGRQKLYDKLHDSRRQITRLERDIAKMADHFANMEEAAYQRALAELRHKQANAIENQDTEEAVRVADEIADLKLKEAERAKQQQSQPQPELTEEFLSWKRDNSWFETDAEMTQDAISIGIGYAATNKNKTQTEILEYVTNKIKKSYPEKFKPTVKKSTQRSAPSVESGNGNGADTNTAAPKKGKLSVQDLDDRERHTMTTFLKKGVFRERAKKLNISEQEVYLQDLAKAKGL